MKVRKAIYWYLPLLIALAACGGSESGSNAPQSATQTPGSASDDQTPITNDPSVVETGEEAEQSFAVSQLTGFDMVDNETWDQTAVRKVLHTFSYGGHATDSQITQWADMRPDLAIVEMLTFDQHNLQTSPLTANNQDQLDKVEGTLFGLAQFWSSDDPHNQTHTPSRIYYNLFEEFGQIEHVWVRAATSRGLNTFRQKIGLWETNYHLAINHEIVPRRVVVNYYDSILSALEEGRPYEEVLAIAAKSAAIALQYGHLNNVYINGECLCNEDFAREYHQLFFGILGSGEHNYHETVSVKNTAAALTDMEVGRDLFFGGYLPEVMFGAEKHTPGTLEILHVGIGGNNAAQRIEELSRYAIEHDESLENLPVMIIGGLADDNLTDDKIYRIRTAWKSMPQKLLLKFLQTYAISTLFHNASRIKYRTSIDRNLLISNLQTLNNNEVYLDLYNPLSTYHNEDVRAFYPTHNVFGGQTGEEASTSSDIFRNNFDRVTLNAWRFATASGTAYGRSWEKDWTSAMPRPDMGYIVQNVTEWLWQRFIADGLKNLGDLERAHLYALLGAGKDLSYILSPNDLEQTITMTDIHDPATNSIITSLGQLPLELESTDRTTRIKANQRIGQAINFIVGTPFMFIEEGR